MPTKAYINPYLAGIILGLLLTLSFVISGRGLGASGAIAQVTASITPSTLDTGGYFDWLTAGTPLWQNWIVIEVVGLVVGAGLSAQFSRRIQKRIIKGNHSSNVRRLIFALCGGILMGFAARLARGCTSGQALSGGALLNSGSWLFMLAVFIGGYATCALIKKEWI